MSTGMIEVDTPIGCRGDAGGDTGVRVCGVGGLNLGRFTLRSMGASCSGAGDPSHAGGEPLGEHKSSKGDSAPLFFPKRRAVVEIKGRGSLDIGVAGGEVCGPGLGGVGEVEHAGVGLGGELEAIEGDNKGGGANPGYNCDGYSLE